MLAFPLRQPTELRATTYAITSAGFDRLLCSESTRWPIRMISRGFGMLNVNRDFFGGDVPIGVEIG